MVEPHQSESDVSLLVLYYPVYLPHQAEAISLAIRFCSGVARPQGLQTAIAVLKRELYVPIMFLSGIHFILAGERGCLM